MKRFLLGLTVLCLLAALLAGCGQTAEQPVSAGKTLVLGDTSFNPENEEPDINPQNAYSGWACIRYGVGETLFRYNDRMEPEPWLAADWSRTDDLTWRITLRAGVQFSTGRTMDAAAVKACLEQLVAVHSRAAGELDLAGIEADGLTLTLHTASPNPTLLNALSDPCCCIIDTRASSDGGIVAGTGPYRAVELVSGQRLELEPNPLYWDGTPKLDHITVRTITDGDTLALALQAGEIDAAYGMPYLNLPQFENDGYTISSTPTSRAFFVWMNFASPVTQDPAVRRAIAMGIDKESFVQVLLFGHGYVAKGVFPDSFSFAGDPDAPDYDPEGARQLLEQAGWTDTDGDGIREKDGQELCIRWLTYPSRQELPLLAECARYTLEQIGIRVEITCTAAHNTLRADPGAWDVYASAMVTAPTGDPAYFFSSCCLDDSPANNGGYHSDPLEALARQLDATFDPAQRGELAGQMQQILLDDNAYVFCSHLQMNLIARAGVTGLPPPTPATTMKSQRNWMWNERHGRDFAVSIGVHPLRRPGGGPPGQLCGAAGAGACHCGGIRLRQKHAFEGRRRVDRPRLPGGGTDFLSGKTAAGPAEAAAACPSGQRAGHGVSGSGGVAVSGADGGGPGGRESGRGAGPFPPGGKAPGAGAVCPAGPARAGRAVAGLSLSAVRGDAAAGGDCHGAASEAQSPAGRRAHQCAGHAGPAAGAGRAAPPGGRGAGAGDP